MVVAQAQRARQATALALSGERSSPPGRRQEPQHTGKHVTAREWQQSTYWNSSASSPTSPVMASMMLRGEWNCMAVTQRVCQCAWGEQQTGYQPRKPRPRSDNELSDGVCGRAGRTWSQSRSLAKARMRARSCSKVSSLSYGSLTPLARGRCPSRLACADMMHTRSDGAWLLAVAAVGQGTGSVSDAGRATGAGLPRLAQGNFDSFCEACPSPAARLATRVARHSPVHAIVSARYSGRVTAVRASRSAR